MRRLREFGVVLLVSLMIVLIIGILGRAVLAMYPGLLSLGAVQQSSDSAQRAAESGLEYALSRLREEPGWKATSEIVVDEDEGLYVVEKDGNVVGLLTDSDGNLSQFRLRFNFQDGDNGGDEMSDPSAGQWIEHPFVSVNNLGTPGHAPLPRASGSDGRVTADDLDDYQAPGQSVYLLVEGRSGPALRSLSKQAPNGKLKGSFSTAVVESCFQLKVNSNSPHASIMAGNDLDITIAPGEQVALTVWGNAEDPTPRLRSKGSVSITEAGGAPGNLNFVGNRGEVGRNDTGATSFQGNPIGQGADLVQENPGDGNGFYQLAWDDVTQAVDNPAATDTIRLPAGTYVAWDDRTVHYYDMSFEDYRTYMSDPGNHADPGIALSPNFDEIREPQNRSIGPPIHTWSGTDLAGRETFNLGFHDDTRILPSGSGVTDFTFTSRRGAAYSPTDDSTLIPGAGDSWTNLNVTLRLQDSTLSTPGDVRLLSSIDAVSSTITTEGDFKMSSSWAKLRHDYGDPDAPYGLNLYARGDIKIGTYKDIAGTFSILAMHGLVYTWGDFEALTGHPDVDPTHWDESEFTGTIVAYGNDPGQGEPGEGTGGRVDIVSSKVGLWSEYGSLAKVVETSAEGVSTDFEQTLFVAH